jgi:hypothetical protein
MSVQAPVVPDHDHFLRFIVDDKYSLYRRIAGVALLSLILTGGNTKQEFSDLTFFCLKMGGFLITLLLLYINIYVLIPKYLFRKKYIHYVIWVAVVIVLSFLVFAGLKEWLPSLRLKPGPVVKNEYLEDFISVVILLSILCAATMAIRLFQRWVKDGYRLTQLENIRMQTELDLLKSQVNPHFLFNMLNNSQVLIQTNPQKASEILIKLSDLLRYQLYDSSREKVLLSADIRFIAQLLTLEKVRRDYFDFNIEQEGTSRQLLIAPLLFVPFVENAVKHNIESVKGAFVELSFKLHEDVLIFKCRNSKAAGAIEMDTDQMGGLGLPNVQRRLELLFPDKHQLSIKDQNGVYEVHLILTL